ncbi:hypothetical protein Ancab_034128, partial [Ancistrocladus abbreviatus]
IPSVNEGEWDRLSSLCDLAEWKVKRAGKEWGKGKNGDEDVLTNGIYRSVEHRAVINPTRERLSVATFYSAAIDREIAPVPCLVTPQNPAQVKRMRVVDVSKGYFARQLDGKSYLDIVSITDDHKN